MWVVFKDEFQWHLEPFEFFPCRSKSLVRFEAGMEAELLQAMCGSEQIPTPLGFCRLSAASCTTPQLGGPGFWAQLLHEEQIHSIFWFCDCGKLLSCPWYCASFMANFGCYVTDARSVLFWLSRDQHPSPCSIYSCLSQVTLPLKSVSLFYRNKCPREEERGWGQKKCWGVNRHVKMAWNVFRARKCAIC